MGDGACRQGPQHGVGVDLGDPVTSDRTTTGDPVGAGGSGGGGDPGVCSASRRSAAVTVSSVMRRITRPACMSRALRSM